MKKRIISIIALALVAVALTSCSKEKKPPLPESAPDHIHEFSAWSTLKKVTCEVDGLKTRSCDCGEIQVEAISSPGHRVSDWITTPATCENDGVKYRKCKVCNAELDREILEAYGHDYTATVFEPSYDLVGYTTYTCSTCSYEFMSDYYPAWGVQELLFSVNSDKKTCTVVKVVQDGTAEILIPEVLAGYTVTAIGNGAFEGCEDLKVVYAPNTVTSIGDRAFSGCVSLTRVHHGDLTSVGDFAFENCSSLEEMSLSSGVEFIGTAAFAGCSSLSEVTLPGTVTQIPDRIFEGCTSLSSVVFADDVTYIGKNAFFECESLKSIPEISEVGIIADGAFFGCKSLASVEFGKSLSYVGRDAFYGNEGLIKVYIPTLEDWFEVSFANGAANPLGGIAELYVNNRVLKTLKVPSSISVISDYQFTGYDHLTSVEISDNVIAMGDYIFSGCTALQNVVIAGYLADIGDGAFYGCTALENVELPKKLSSIPKSAFVNCVELSSIKIPDGVKVIEKEAFYGCSTLDSVDFGKSLVIIGDSAFYGCSKLEKVEFPETLVIISDMSFANCGKLLELVLPDGLICIGAGAFENCSAIVSVVMPEKLKVVSANAFAGCSEIADVYVKDLSNWCKVSFGNTEANPVHNKGLLYLNGKLLTELVITSDIKSISDYAFCDSGSIDTIYFTGTAEEYDKVIGNNNVFLKKMILSERVYYYSAVEPAEQGCYWYYNDFGKICKW